MELIMESKGDSDEIPCSQNEMLNHLRIQAEHCVFVSNALLSEGEQLKLGTSKNMGTLLHKNLEVAKELEKVVQAFTEDGANSNFTGSAIDSPLREFKSPEEQQEDFRGSSLSSEIIDSRNDDSEETSLDLDKIRGFDRDKYTTNKQLKSLAESSSSFGRMVRGLDPRREVEENLLRKFRSLQNKHDSLRSKLIVERKRSTKLVEQLGESKRAYASLEVDLRRALQTREEFATILEDETRKAWREFEETKRSHDHELKQMRTDFEMARKQLKKANLEVDELRARLKAQSTSLESKTSKLEHSVERFQRESGEMRVNLQMYKAKNDELVRQNEFLKQENDSVKQSNERELRELKESLCEIGLDRKKLAGELAEKSNDLEVQIKRRIQAEAEREQERKAVSSLKESFEALRSKLSTLDREKCRINDRAERAEAQAHELEGKQSKHSTRAEVAEAHVDTLRKRIETLQSESVQYEHDLEQVRNELRKLKRENSALSETAERGKATVHALQSVTKDLYNSRNNAIRLLEESRDGCSCQDNRDKIQKAASELREAFNQERDEFLKKKTEEAMELKLACAVKCEQLTAEITRLKGTIKDQAATIHQLSC